MRMTISVSGLLLNAAADLETIDDPGAGSRAHGLRQLHDHLKELRTRHRDGDATVVDEFFDLYSLDDRS